MGSYYLNLSLPLSDGSWRSGYDFVDLNFFTTLLWGKISGKDAHIGGKVLN